MSVIWQKVWSDLWDNKLRTILAVLSITVGVFAVGAIFGMSDQLLSGMDAAHQASIPAHFTIALTKRITADTANRLEKIKGITGEIALGNFEVVNYKVNLDDEWKTAWLVMREDYENQEYELLPLKAGEWPKGNRVGLERLSSQSFGLDIGDSVYFEIDNRPKLRKIGGKMRHNFVPPPDFGGPAVFFTDAEGLEAFGVPRGEYSQIIVRVAPYSPELARQVASEIKDRLSKEGIGVAVTIFQDPEKHWGRSFMEGINLVLQVMAVVSLGASVVLVFNTLTGLITQQTHQIGMLKAIGGTQGQIVKIYMVGVLVYGGLSLLIALPLGMMMAYGITRNFLNLFNIDYEQFRFSTLAVGLQFLAALAVPLLAALWPVLHGTSLTVREAISSYGLGSGKFGTSRLDRLIEGFGHRFLSAPYAVALGNMFRRKGRLLLTQVVLVLAGTMFLAVMSLSTSINLTIDNIFSKHKYDTIIVFNDNERVDRVQDIAHSHPAVVKAEVWFSHGASLLKAGQRLKEAGLGAELIGIPNGSDAFRPPLLLAGRWLAPDDGPAIILRKDTADDNNIKVGDTVILDVGELGDAEWQVVGMYQDIFSGIGETDPIYANLEAVFTATKKHNEGGQARINLKRHDEPYVQQVTTELKQMFEAKNVDVADSLVMLENRRNADSQFAITINMMLILAVLMALVGGIGLMGALSISVVERTREIGVMRAIGARTPTILGMFMMEGVLQGLLSWLVVIPISFILGRPMANALGMTLFDASLDYQYNYQAVLVWLVIILVISTVASVLPARTATQISVRDSLAYS
jgi:putative ABC transport system permease protein